MELTTKETTVVEKTKELCQAIVDQESFAGLMNSLDAFMSSEEAQGLYERVRQKQEFLQDRQRRGEEVTDEDYEDFERERNALFSNEIAAGFIEAQEKLQNVQQTVNQYLTRTFELGHVPAPDELKSGGGCCGGGGGGGCGCSSS